MTAILETSKDSLAQDPKHEQYTVITFAPVQGFIEKSRKLRDLYGASQILSYLSWKIVAAAKHQGFVVISPAIAEEDITNVANADIVQGMPNRILIKGDFSYNDAHQALMKGWQEIVEACREWLRNNLNKDSNENQNKNSNENLREDSQFDDSGWANSWTRWKIHAWELFWGGGSDIESAMQNLETRKLRRGWTVPNWNGESSSLSGHDAIAYPNMDREITKNNKRNEGRERDEIIAFYERLAAALESSKQQHEPKYLDPSEKLSIPELIKRLVTHHQVSTIIDRLANQNRIIKREAKPVFRIDNFSELLRKDDESGETYWTGWFMGDGDEVGKHLKSLTEPEDVKNFSRSLRNWGNRFQKDFKSGRVVYAGGDDFFGVMYSQQKGIKLKGADAINWLIHLRKYWRGEDKNSEQLGIKLSMGFVWAGHSVPQRDVLQHCREAEKLAKSLGRDRVTIRVVFNNGQYVQWTTPWECLGWLKDYEDRDGGTNWSHVYGDLAQLKARHAIPQESYKNQDSAIALALFKLYFGDRNHDELFAKQNWITTGDREDYEVKQLIQWIENMINVGWQLCSNG